KPKPSVVDISKEINSINASTKVKIITKDFLKNSYKDDYFDIVFFNNCWGHIPIEAEIKYIKETQKKSKSNAIYLVLSKNFSTDEQVWKEYEFQKQIYNCYVKKFTK